MVATLIRVLGDFELAEERCRTRSPPRSSAGRATATPRQPGAWLVTTARNRAIDRIRRERTLARKTELLAAARRRSETERRRATSRVPDDRLRLIFTCCHPALAPEAQVALTLRAVGGPDDARDRARVPRARADDGAAARAREAEDPRRGHPVPRAARRTCCPSGSTRCSPSSTSSSTRATRHPAGDGSCAATSARRRSGSRKLLAGLMPDEPEALGLLALMLLHDSRRAARIDADGDAGAARGPGPRAVGPRPRSPRASRCSTARCARRPGRTSCRRRSPPSTPTRTGRDTDWARDRALYDELVALAPSPVVELNRAVAVAMADGPDARARR